MLEIPKTAEKLRNLALESSRGKQTGEAVVSPRKDKKRGKNGLPSRKKARRKPRLSFLICVVAPVVATVLYFVLIASDQYAAEAKFSIRGSETQTSGDLLGMMTGFTGSSASSTDSYMVASFIESRELVEKLDKQVDLRKLYSRPEADYLASADPDWPIEKLVEYWESMVHVYFDTYSGITEFEVRAFTKEDAELIARHVLAMSERLVNDISLRERDDAVGEAKSEVARAENRLRMARTAVANFRETSKSVDPTAVATAEQAIVSTLEAELAQLRTQLRALTSMAEDAPRVVYLKTQIEALEKQIEHEKTKVAINSTGDGETLTKKLKMYEDLRTEEGFAEKAYLSALTSLERARVEADRQQRYIAVFVNPKVPEYPLYPERLRWTLIILFGCFVVWGIGSLTVAGVRDHVS
ncbi:MAG: hypothetical protein C0606_01745 [Hyphomicrobiales bacterium]|nr:MAG: hypothetical protein C0606_01745 [Hyphomicrobiales bacterium]